MEAMSKDDFARTLHAHLTRELDSDSLIYRAVDYHLQVPGKMSRAELAWAMSAATKLSGEEYLPIALCVEALHNASLIHDDIQDRDEYRRGQLALWVEFGEETAICVGDLFISAAYRALAQLPASYIAESLTLVHERVARTISGQIDDCCYKQITSFIEYEAIALSKSAPLFSLPAELTLMASGNSSLLRLVRESCNAFALGYQLCDDIDDFMHDRFKESNAVVVVLGENKTSVPAAKDEVSNRALHWLKLSELQARRLPKPIQQPVLSLISRHQQLIPRLRLNDRAFADAV